jgi:hypothetical protein
MTTPDPTIPQPNPRPFPPPPARSLHDRCEDWAVERLRHLAVLSYLKSARPGAEGSRT